MFNRVKPFYSGFYSEGNGQTERHHFFCLPAAEIVYGEEQVMTIIIYYDNWNRYNTRKTNKLYNKELKVNRSGLLHSSGTDEMIWILK